MKIMLVDDSRMIRNIQKKTLAQLGERICKTPEQFKAWSQNLGHEKVLTTFTSYGEVASPRQAEIIRALAQPEEPDAQVIELARTIMEATRQTPSSGR